MSLFATDASLLGAVQAPKSKAQAPAPVKAVPPAAALPATAASNTKSLFAKAPVVVPTVVAQRDDSDVANERLAALLPSLAQAAIRRGYVRSAAMLHETAMRHLEASNGALEKSRVLIDTCSSIDASMQRRQIAGESIVIASCAESSEGIPRFQLGFSLEELSHPVVYAFAKSEIADGALAEYRNFLDETLRSGDTVIDLDAGVGAGLLTAATALVDHVHITAFTSDAILSRALHRNIAVHRASGHERHTITLLDGEPSASAFDAAAVKKQGSRVVIHLGVRPAGDFQRQLLAYRNRPVALAWALERAENARALQQMGYESFVLAMRGDEPELVPAASVTGAEYAFALSPTFITSLGEAH